MTQKWWKEYEEKEQTDKHDDGKEEDARDKDEDKIRRKIKLKRIWI